VAGSIRYGDTFGNFTPIGSGSCLSGGSSWTNIGFLKIGELGATFSVPSIIDGGENVGDFGVTFSEPSIMDGGENVGDFGATFSGPLGITRVLFKGFGIRTNGLTTYVGGVALLHKYVFAPFLVHSTEFISVITHLHPLPSRSFIVVPPAKLSEPAKNWDEAIITTAPTIITLPIKRRLRLRPTYRE